MRLYLWVSGTIFALLTVAHIARSITESHSFATNPEYVVITLFAAAMAVWAGVLLRKKPDGPTA